MVLPEPLWAEGLLGLRNAECSPGHQRRRARAERPVRTDVQIRDERDASSMLSPVPAMGTRTPAWLWAAGAGWTGSLELLQAGTLHPCPGFADCNWQAALLGPGRQEGADFGKKV